MVKQLRLMNIYGLALNVGIRIGMKNKYICTCGHIEKEHEYRFDIFYDPYKSICWSCFQLPAELVSTALSYHTFKPDNLKYLELIYEEKPR